MSAFERTYRRKLRQKAVFWASPSTDGFGKVTFAAPIEIDCRWDDRAELFIDINGKERPSSSVVFTDRDLELEGYLVLDVLENLTTAQKADPHTIDAARQILGYEKVPTVKVDFFVRKAFL
jgi:hypothetical protein